METVRQHLEAIRDGIEELDGETVTVFEVGILAHVTAAIVAIEGSLEVAGALGVRYRLVEDGAPTHEAP